MEQIKIETFELNLPNFFIVGAAKAGTSSLWTYLKGHPEVFMPMSNLHKEPAFFCNNWGMNSLDRYIQLFSSATSENTRIGEASTAYLACPESAALIHDYQKKYNKNLKIIIMLRNPVARAYSLYRWNVQSGIEVATSFEKALKLEKKRLTIKLPQFWTPATYRNQYLYFQTGLYSDQIERYLSLFAPENIHIEIFEDFISDTNSSFKNICHFLDVSDGYQPDVHVVNPSTSVRSTHLQVLLRRITNKLIHFKMIRNCGTIEERDFLMKIGLVDKKPAPLNQSLKEELLTKFKNDIEKLSEMLDRDMLSVWGVY